MQSFYRSILMRFGLLSSLELEERVKSWDLLETVRSLNADIKKSDWSLNIGCCSSEILTSLNKPK